MMDAIDRAISRIVTMKLIQSSHSLLTDIA